MQLTSSSLLAAGLLAMSWLGGVAADKSAGCGKTATYKTGQQYTMTVNGKQRQYFVRLPDHYDSSHPYRIAYLWHERGSTAQKIVNGENINQGGVSSYYGLPPLANNSMIFVVPNGLNNGWANNGGEDTTFFDQLVEAVEGNLCTDTNLRFSTGFSWGAGMTYSLACNRASKLRAVAVISGAVLSGCTGGNDPVPYYAQHGTSDSVLNVSNGRQLRDRFVKNNGCTAVSPEPQPSGNNPTKTVYKGCKTGYPLTWVIHNGDHNPSQRDSSGHIFAPTNTWEFWSQFS